MPDRQHDADPVIAGIGHLTAKYASDSVEYELVKQRVGQL